MKRLTGLAALVLVASAYLVASSVAFALEPKPNNRPMATKAGQSPFNANPRACQAKEAAVKQRSLQLTKMALNMEDRFATIAARVENFYLKQATSGGQIVPNYDVLVADVAAKKAAVSTALATAQVGVTNFSCTSNDPKGQLAQFRLDMQGVKDTLKDYRTSIKNLIVAIRSAVSKGGESE